MSIFNFGNKKVKTDNISSEITTNENRKMEFSSIKILGSGCTKCNQLESATKAALEQLGMDTSINHVTDFTQIAAYGVMTTPALVVDEKVLSFGKVLKTDEIAKLIQKARE